MIRHEQPSLVCASCAEKAGGRVPDGHMPTYHYGICDVCGVLRAVTAPRDFGYPDFKVKHKKGTA